MKREDSTFSRDSKRSGVLSFRTAGEMSTWYTSPILDRFGGGGYAVVVLLALALGGAWTAGVLFTRLSTPRRIVLATLRLLVVILLVLAMVRPTRVYTDVRPQSATLVILLDRSRSMTVQDAFGGKSRWEALVKAFRD